jgi:hypothetical protein
MRKGVLIAVGAAVLVAAVAVGAWWMLGRDEDAPIVAAKSKVDPNETPQARAERIRAGIAHGRQLWREASYIEIRQAAMDDDPVAQRRLSELYEECRAYSSGLSTALRMLGTLSEADPRSKPTVAGIYRDFKRYCVQADADLRRNPDAASYWLHRSAKAGDLTSEMRFIARNNPALEEGQLEYFVDRLRETGDPDAIFEMGVLLPKAGAAWPDEAQAAAFKGERAQAAWMIAACRAGYDCARGSRVLNTICINTLNCQADDYLRYLLKQNEKPEQRAELSALLRVVERDVLRSGPAAPLPAAPAPPPPPPPPVPPVPPGASTAAPQVPPPTAPAL